MIKEPKISKRLVDTLCEIVLPHFHIAMQGVIVLKPFRPWPNLTEPERCYLRAYAISLLNGDLSGHGCTLVGTKMRSIFTTKGSVKVYNIERIFRSFMIATYDGYRIGFATQEKVMKKLSVLAATRQTTHEKVMGNPRKMSKVPNKRNPLFLPKYKMPRPKGSVKRRHP